MAPFFSQLRVGVGVPVALHSRVSSSPRGHSGLRTGPTPGWLAGLVGHHHRGTESNTVELVGMSIKGLTNANTQSAKVPSLMKCLNCCL